MKPQIIYILLFFTLFTGVVVAQEAQLTTTVSKNKLGVNQRLRVQFSINKQGADNFRPPNFKNFKVVGGPSQSINQSWINGKASFSQSYAYTIQPLRKGEFSIPSASIEFKGKTLRSKPVKVIVLDPVEIPKDPNDPNYIAEQNIHLVAEVSKTKPYVGEGIYVEYKLYVSPNISVHDYSLTESPQYNGFWNQDIEIKGLKVKKGKYNGEEYRYVVLKRALLIPTKTGKLSIDPIKMDIVIGVPTGRVDFFGNSISKNIRRAFASPKKTILPKQLPIVGKPEGFNGAVGDFNFAVTASKDLLKANETSQIKVSVTGKGNLKLFEIPKIKTPAELEVYTPEHKEKVAVTTTGIRGTISDQYTVVPQFKGKYKIPNVSFSYFNPKDKKYHTLLSEDLFVNVIEGKAIANNSDEKRTLKRNVVFTGENFRYIQTKSALVPVKAGNFFPSNFFYFWLFLPLLMIPVGIVIAKKTEERNQDIIGNKQRKADRLAKKYLSEAAKKLGKKEHFYEALEKALHNYLKAKLNIETTDISSDKISVILESKNIEPTTIQQFLSVLKECDFARFTPTTNTEMQSEYEKAKRVIAELDKQF